MYNKYLINIIRKNFGKIDILINNASSLPIGKFNEVTEKDWKSFAASFDHLYPLESSLDIWGDSVTLLTSQVKFYINNVVQNKGSKKGGFCVIRLFYYLLLCSTNFWFDQTVSAISTPVKHIDRFSISIEEDEKIFMP